MLRPTDEGESFNIPIQDGSHQDRKYYLVVVREGAMREQGNPVAVTDAAGNKILGGIRRHVGKRTTDQIGAQTCVIVLGHTQRGGKLMP